MNRIKVFKTEFRNHYLFSLQSSIFQLNFESVKLLGKLNIQTDGQTASVYYLHAFFDVRKY
jgi:hypothetical protein